MIKINKKNSNKGFSLVEMIFYIALFALLTIVIVKTLVTMTKSFKEVSVQREITQGGEILERISREIRQANKINTAVDVEGDFRLDSKDESGNYKLVEFVLTNSNIRLLENNNYIGDLNSPNIKVTTLNFYKLATAQGNAVRIFLTISSKHDSKNRSYSYQNTVVLRGNY